jgi:hypothetical protein
MSRLFSLVVPEKPLIGAAHAFLVQLVSFQAPITGTLSAPADIQRTADAFQMLARDVQVSGGGRQVGVSEQALQNGTIDTGPIKCVAKECRRQ